MLRCRQMGQPLGGLMREGRVRQLLDNPLQRNARRLRVLRKLQMPVGDGCQGRGLSLRGGGRSFHPAFQGELRARQIIQIFHEDGGQQHDAAKILREFFQLFPHERDRLLRMAVAPLGFGGGIERLGLHRHVAAVKRAGDPTSHHRADTGHPNHADRDRWKDPRDQDK